MSIHFEKVKIQSVRIDDDYYDHKKKKRIKYSTPKIEKKTLFEDTVYDIGELYLQLKNCHDRDPYNPMEVTLKSTQEY
tara:strand:- start:271 stop:504 length:234 start_codon:yes stop_codon:yes gene_type:complete